MKSRIYNYVAGVTTHANPCRDATTWVVSANTFFWFLNRPFFILGSRCAIARRPVLTIYTSYGIFLCKDVPFGIPVAAIPHLGDQVPKNLFWGREYAFLPSVLFAFSAFCLQCFDAVGWAAGRASGL